MRINRLGPDWLAIKRQITEMIEDGRGRLEVQLSPEQYHFERGRIASLRELLALGEPEATPPLTGDDYDD